jgi:thymidylate synthase
MHADLIFASTLETILRDGSEIKTRNSVTKRARNLSATFTSTPLVSVRKTAWKLALREMEWFLSGSNNINDLHPSVRHWWQPWADEQGLINNNYSIQFCDFVGHYGSVNQVDALVTGVQKHPFSRRNVITTWNTADMLHPSTPITNCHNSLTQAFVEPDNSLHLTTYQRSSDMVLGVPHNFIQMWAFLQYLAHRSQRTVGSLTWLGGDCHIYESHIEAAQRIIATDISSIKTPNLIYTPTSEAFRAEDFTLDSDYKPLNSEKLVMIV